MEKVVQALLLGVANVDVEARKGLKMGISMHVGCMRSN
jgi:hypothetical protein